MEKGPQILRVKRGIIIVYIIGSTNIAGFQVEPAYHTHVSHHEQRPIRRQRHLRDIGVVHGAIHGCDMQVQLGNLRCW